MKNLEVLNKNENKLLGFNEFEILAEFDTVPSKEEAAKFLSKNMDVSDDKCVVKKISGSFGTRKVKIIARIYGNKENRQEVELLSKGSKEKKKPANK